MSMMLFVRGTVLASGVAIGLAATVQDAARDAGTPSPVDRNCWDRSQWGTPQREADENDVAGPVFVSHDLTSNRHHGMSPGTLQVVTFYDGDEWGGLRLRIEYARVDGRTGGWIEIEGLHRSTSDGGRIDTFEYDLRGGVPTGRFEVAGVRPNGVIDGLAFGLFWRDAEGFHVLRSTRPEPSGAATFVGAWPIALNDRALVERTPQLSTGHARQQAAMTIYGAEYLDDGGYLITIQERAVRLGR